MNTQPQLSPKDFDKFFFALYHEPPFRWQVRMAERACRGVWPRSIKLPTASGKTSCLDIAVFALAYQAYRRHATGQAIEMPRRMFFVVDRRIVVNQTHQRAVALADALADPEAAEPLAAVAYWLKDLSAHPSAPPLDCFELRGGIYRDDAWVRSPLQPTIVTSTVDQIGSRLLFRGYGVPDHSLSIHAALTANDALILLDEAHCSQPFSQTLAAIARYRDADLPAEAPGRWAEEPLRTPFCVAEMTATPRNAGDEVFALEEADYQADPVLAERHLCAKPVRLVTSNAKGGKQNALLAKALVERALELADGAPCRRIAIVVNRVACARAAYELLREKHGDRVALMIGRMRPIDRDWLTDELEPRFESNSKEEFTEPHFVVATQCLEVGADFDFDGMVSQCASLDALRQRFGRLNRVGRAPHARGVIVMAEGDLAPKKPDPIYDAALPATWQWLNAQARDGFVDLGVRALEATLAQSRVAVETLTAPALDAPVLMPAHVDLLCQTSPRPAVEPEIAAFLHGPNRGTPEVLVCWRADMPDESHADWEERCRATLAVCPPSSPECLSVPLPEFKAWLRGETRQDSGDLLGETVEDEEARASDAPANRRGVVWTGRECRAVSARNAEEFAAVRPQAVIVLPATAGGWSTLGHVPEAIAEPDGSGKLTTEERQALAPIDLGADAYERSRNRQILRVHPSLPRPVLEGADNDALLQFAADETKTWSGTWLGDESNNFGPPLRYPSGFVLIGPRKNVRAELPRASFDDDLEEHNLDAEKKIPLAVHTADVVQETRRNTERLNLPPTLCQALIAAAERHDLGKADPRFQALLLNSSLAFAELQPTLWAKSARGAGAAKPVQVPAGFRHEMLSLQFAAAIADDLADADRDLMLHAIAAHHGRARPWAPVVDDPSPPEVSLNGFACAEGRTPDVTLTSAERLAVPPHRLDSGVARRFWNLNRRFGWWGLAWLETTLRLADWTASAAPRQSRGEISFTSREQSLADKPVDELTLEGMNGANPLAFLATLGVLRTLTGALPDADFRLAWTSDGVPRPQLQSRCGFTAEDCVAALHTALRERQGADHFVRLGKNINVPRAEFRAAAEHAVANADRSYRTTVDFLAAFGSDALVSPNDDTTIQDTALRTMAGAGHQHFLETMRNLIENCEPEHLAKTLFRAWIYDDPTQTLSLRYDPADDNRYALRWRNPSGDPARKSSGSMLGANRLAIEALPLFPTAPGERRLRTTACTGFRSDDTYLHWPLWSAPLTLLEVQTLLMSRELLDHDGADDLRQRGVTAVLRSQRITVGKVRNFSPGHAAWSALVSR